MIRLVERWLGLRATPVVFALLTAGLFGWMAGSLAPLPWVYDEAAYLLQAKIFATGHWSAPGRPLPEFFEQLHVFVTPRLVPKYPPGHALLMVPGVWLGAPWLMPLVFLGLTGGLVFGFARSLLGEWSGLLTWTIWITAPEVLYLAPSYMSQVSTTLVWLLAWWAVDRWRARPDARRLTLVAVLAATGLLIRPITAIAFLVPIGIIVVGQAFRSGAWRSLAIAGGVALPIVGVAGMWSYSTGGRLYPTPYSEYSRVYAPWNMPGFSIDRRPPERAETPAVTRFRTEWLPLHERHTIRRLPLIIVERLRGIGTTFFGDGGAPGVPAPWRWLLLGGFALGLARLPRPIWFALVSGAALFVAMLWLASRPLWTVYYLESFPVLAAITAFGTWKVARWIGSKVHWVSSGALVLGGLAVAVPGTVERLIRAKQQQTDLREIQTALAQAAENIAGRAIVFVAPGPEHRPHESYVTNEPDLAATRVWIVHDRGADNARLLALAPDRKPFRFDPATGMMTELPAP